MRRFDWNDFSVWSMLGVVILCIVALGFVVFRPLPAEAQDLSKEWYTSYGHVRQVYFNWRDSRTVVILEADDNKVLPISIYTYYAPVPVWPGEYVKLEFGNRDTSGYPDARFHNYKVTKLSEPTVGQGQMPPQVKAEEPTRTGAVKRPYVAPHHRRRHKRPAKPCWLPEGCEPQV